ncbi:hypothetical protein [Hymenobacter chitinivorans]|uniref:Uncharacterized protein n=1 Tax=Hymenobacter chitinivorans DSM 11115 TaxID=1121954 RepID=A0A2M9B5G3_9BACT|nr:hypothetical protein [Hymenobacter chitinivorans]PJJ53184.1 hypothetical protein CLV45_3842 [Hymenobacter chitinivorans DSM 11115]
MYTTVGYDELLRVFKQRGRRGDTLLAPPVIYRGSVYSGTVTCQKQPQFEVHLAEQPLLSQRQTVRLTNPFGGAEYPASYSVIYRHCLVVLVAPGKFACYRLQDLRRNELLEQQL